MKVKILFLALLGAAALACAVLLVACQKDTYVIQYEYNGAVRLEVVEGKVFALEELPSRLGYTFAGLYDASEGGEQVVDANGMSCGPYERGADCTLYARFIPNTYTIRLEYEGGESASGVRQVEAAYDAAIEGIPFDLTMRLHEFAGWFTAPAMGGVQVADAVGMLPGYERLCAPAYTLADTITLYAGFTEVEYEVTFCYRMDGSDDVTVSAVHGASLASIEPQDHLVDGQYVLAWSTVPNDTAQAYTFNGSITKDMTLYPSRFGYSISFDPNGGSPCHTIRGEAGTPVSMPRPARAGYRFMGWLLEGERYSSSVIPSQNISLVAEWQPLLTFEENGGTEVDDISAPAGEPISLPRPVRAGYEFAGWYTSPEGGELFEEEVMPAEGLTLYAGWYRSIGGEATLSSMHVGEGSSLIEGLTIDLGETFPEQGSLSAAFTVSYAVQVEGYTSPGDKPSNFQLLLCNDSAGTSPAAIAALPIAGASGNYSGSLTASLAGSRVYVRVQTDPWDAGYTLRSVVIGYTVTDRSHVIF